MNKKTLLILLSLFLSANNVFAQYIADSTKHILADSSKIMFKKVVPEKDLMDVIHGLRKKKNNQNGDKKKTETDNYHFALVPGGGYSLQTGVAGFVAANFIFYNDSAKLQESTIAGNIAYTQYKQIIFPINANVWTKQNTYNFISDFRYMNYPSVTFGLGAKSRITNEYDIDYDYIKLHQTVLRRISTNISAGIGYYYDYFWNVKEINPPANTVTSFQRYGLTTTETASGINYQAIFDNRDNPVNPFQGLYVSARYRTNYKWLGSNSNWSQGILEIKKYFTFPRNSKNVLALWNYNWFTFSGKPPYLLLPSTGWDDFYNTGRGYIQGRYRANDMSYLEAEYRFRITRNGLIGGVVFGNVQSFSRAISDEFKDNVLGYGLGIRVKMNKNSLTNLCIDYGFGSNGSGGIFINLGEVF